MTIMTGAELLTKSIRQYGVDTIFALPGFQLNLLFDALYRNQEEGFGSRHISSKLQNLNFMRQADSFGVMEQRVS